MDKKKKGKDTYRKFSERGDRVTDKQKTGRDRERERERDKNK